MTQLRSVVIGLILAVVVVVVLQPIYFFGMANLDRVISHDAMRAHFRDAFQSGVLSDELHPTNLLFTGGDRYTDCIALSAGMQPDQSALDLGILAPVPPSDRHSCEYLRDIADGKFESLTWSGYYRYWHGYRVYYAPLASLLPIYALRLVNLLLLAAFTAGFFWQSSKLIGRSAAVALVMPLFFLSDLVRVWQVTPHVLGVIVILAGAAIFSFAVRRRMSDYALLVMSAAFGSFHNFIDFLVNPPWMPMLLAFFVLAGLKQEGRRSQTLAIAVTLSWFGGYALTWVSKWVICYFLFPDIDVISKIRSMIQFRINGDYSKVVHLPLFPTLKVLQAAIVSWGAPVFAIYLYSLFKDLKKRNFGWRPFWLLAWPSLIPPIWFEILSNHSQIHAGVTSRSEAAAIGVLIAAVVICFEAAGAFEDTPQTKGLAVTPA
jgi:hypothetical protein